MQQPEHGRLTFRAALGLAAPHTWGAASLFPTFFGAALATSDTGRLDLPMFFVLLVIVILMHSAVNTLNDYYDFIKGTDTVANSDDPSDAILVYNKLNTRHVLWLSLSYLGLAALLGVYVVFRSGFVPLIVGAVGGLTIVAYSAGKLPISYLPLGELVSGFVMGGLIPLAVYTSLTGRLDFLVLVKAIPFILGIALIMMTNNTCDIERDTPAGRRTLPVMVGRVRARFIYRGIVVLWLLWVGLMGALFFRNSLFLFPTLLILRANVFAGPLRTSLTPETRGMCFSRILTCNEAADTLYLAMILVNAVLR